MSNDNDPPGGTGGGGNNVDMAEIHPFRHVIGPEEEDNLIDLQSIKDGEIARMTKERRLELATAEINASRMKKLNAERRLTNSENTGKVQRMSIVNNEFVGQMRNNTGRMRRNQR